MLARLDWSFFERRLTMVLFGLTIKDYHEDYLNGRIAFTVVGRVWLEDSTIKKIRQLFEASVVTLTPFGNSANIVARGVIFPFIQ